MKLTKLFEADNRVLLKLQQDLLEHEIKCKLSKHFVDEDVEHSDDPLGYALTQSAYTTIGTTITLAKASIGSEPTSAYFFVSNGLRPGDVITLDRKYNGGSSITYEATLKEIIDTVVSDVLADAKCQYFSCDFKGVRSTVERFIGREGFKASDFQELIIDKLRIAQQGKTLNDVYKELEERYNGAIMCEFNMSQDRQALLLVKGA